MPETSNTDFEVVWQVLASRNKSRQGRWVCPMCEEALLTVADGGGLGKVVLRCPGGCSQRNILAILLDHGLPRVVFRRLDPTGTSKLGTILRRSELANLRKPEPLIDQWLELGTAAVVIGETGSNKSFALLGWACSVATGTAWLGFSVRIDSSPVILVVGEGAHGLNSRIRAWEEASGLVVPDDKLVIVQRPESDLLDDGLWTELAELSEDVGGAALVAFDTLSSLSPGADETKDSATILRHMTDLADEIHACVVLVHHTGWENKARARGGSQLEANPDNVILFRRSEDPSRPVSIFRKKDKEGEAGLRVWVRRRPMGDSCVLETVDAPDSDRSEGRASDIKAAVLQHVDDADPFTFTQSGLEKAVGGNHERTRKAIQALINDGVLVVKETRADEGERKAIRRNRVGRAGPTTAASTSNA